MPFSVNAEILTSELAPNVSPYELLEQSRVNRKFYNAWQSNDLWLGFLKHYFPGKQRVIQEMEGLVLESNQGKSGEASSERAKITPDGVVKAEFIRLAKKLSRALQDRKFFSLKDCEPHVVDKAFMSCVLQCSEPEQLNDKLRELCKKNGLLHAVVRHTKTLQQLLLSLYPDNEKRSKAVMIWNNNGSTVLHCAAETPESLKVILSLYPESERLAAVKEKNNDGNTVLHCSANTPESLKAVLSLYPENERLTAVQKINSKGNTVLHLATNTPESLKAALSLLLEKERLEAVKKKNRYHSTVLHLSAEMPESLKVLLSLYPENERLAAVKEKDCSGKTVLHWAAETPDSLKVLLSLYPENERLAAVKDKNHVGPMVLHRAVNIPEALKAVLNLLPEKERLTAVKEKNSSGETVLHCAAKTPESLKVLLSLLPEQERLAAVKEKNSDGSTVLHCAAETPESLKAVLSLYPENERLAAVKEKNRYYDTVLNRSACIPDALKALLTLLPEHNRFEILRERVSDIPLAERLIGADLLLEDSFTQDYLVIYKLLNSKRDRVGFFSNALSTTTLFADWTQAQNFDDVKQGIIHFLSHPEHSQSTLAQQLLNELLTGEDKTVEALCAKWALPRSTHSPTLDG